MIVTRYGAVEPGGIWKICIHAYLRNGCSILHVILVRLHFTLLLLLSSITVAPSCTHRYHSSPTRLSIAPTEIRRYSSCPKSHSANCLSLMIPAHHQQSNS